MQRQKAPLFERTFPKVASIRYSAPAVMQVDHGKLMQAVVEIFGPFMFIISEGRNYLLFVRHYCIRTAFKNMLIQFIPMNPLLVQKFSFFMSTLEDYKSLHRILQEASKSMDWIPPVLAPFVFDCEVFEEGKGFVKTNIAVTQNQVLLTRAGYKTVIPICIELKITTEFSALFKLVGYEFVAFAICMDYQDPILVRFKAAEMLLCAVTSIESQIQKLKDGLSLNMMKEPHFACPWPIDQFTTTLKVQQTFEFKQERTVLTRPCNFHFYDVDFSVMPAVPKSASTELTLIDIKKPFNRSAIFNQDRGDQYSRPVIENRDKQFHEGGDYKETLKSMLGDETLDDLVYPRYDRDIVFSIRNKLDNEYYSMKGSELTSALFTPPTVKGIFDRDVERLGITFIGRDAPAYGQDIVENIYTMITKLPENVNTESKEFLAIVHRLSSIIVDGADISRLHEAMDIVVHNDSIIRKCCPLNYTTDVEFIGTLVARLIQKHKLRVLFTELSSRDIMNSQFYTETAFMRIRSFVDNLACSVAPLEKLCFSGSMSHAFDNFGSFEIFQHHETAVMIVNDVESVYQTSVYAPNETNVAVCRLLKHVRDFLKDGFIIHTRESLWTLFKKTCTMKISDPEFGVFRAVVAETKKQVNMKQLQVPHCLFRGLQCGILSIWILYLVSSAHTHNTHEKDALVNTKQAVLVIAEALKKLSSVMFTMEPSALYLYAHLL